MNVNEFKKAWEDIGYNVKRVEIEDGTIYADSYDIAVSSADENLFLYLSLGDRAVANIFLSKVTGVE